MADVSTRNKRGGLAGNNRARPYPSAPTGSWKLDAPRAPNARNTTAEFSISDRIVVSNLHYEVTPQDLVTIFETMGSLAREPTIRYDRSGRSLGVAQVTFVNPGDAALAHRRLDGVSAKGQPMSIVLEKGIPAPSHGNFSLEGVPTGPRAAGRGTAGSLLNRMSKPPLLQRLDQSLPRNTARQQQPSPQAPRAPRSHKQQPSTRNPPSAPRQPKTKPTATPATPKTAQDLDRELEAYLVDDSLPAAEVVANGAGEDVEMH